MLLMINKIADTADTQEEEENHNSLFITMLSHDYNVDVIAMLRRNEERQMQDVYSLSW